MVLLAGALGCDNIHEALPLIQHSVTIPDIPSAIRTYHCLEVGLEVKRLFNPHALLVERPSALDDCIQPCARVTRVGALGEPWLNCSHS